MITLLNLNYYFTSTSVRPWSVVHNTLSITLSFKKHLQKHRLDEKRTAETKHFNADRYCDVCKMRFKTVRQFAKHQYSVQELQDNTETFLGQSGLQGALGPPSLGLLPGLPQRVQMLGGSENSASQPSPYRYKRWKH